MKLNFAMMGATIVGAIIFIIAGTNASFVQVVDVVSGILFLLGLCGAIIWVVVTIVVLVEDESYRSKDAFKNCRRFGYFTIACLVACPLIYYFFVYQGGIHISISSS